jgi:hypothetical protein
MHSCVYVLIGPDTKNIEAAVARALAPFDEALPIRPYKLHINRSAAEQMAKHYGLKADDLKSLVPKVRDWVGGSGGIDAIGLFTTRSDNPFGKWDWYEIGGRWDGYLTGKTPPRDADESGPIEDNSMQAATLFKNRKLPARLPAAVVTPTGEWVEEESFVTRYYGWFVVQRTKRDWLSVVRRILAAFPTHTVVCVDVHY